MKLSENEKKILSLWFLGGSDAIGKHSTNTINSLYRKGLLDRNGLSEKGKSIAKENEEKGFVL
jgi:hypothetical protein